MPCILKNKYRGKLTVRFFWLFVQQLFHRDDDNVAVKDADVKVDRIIYATFVQQYLQ